MSTGLRRQSFRSKSKSNLARIQNRDQKSGRFISKKTAGLTPNSDEYVIESNRLSPRAAESRKNSIQSRRTWESSPESLLDSVLVRTPQSKSNRNSKNSKQKSKNSAYARRLVVSNLSQIEEDESERKSQWVEDENSKPSVNAKRKLENSLKEIELSEKLPHKMVDTQGGKKRFENSEVHSEESSKPLNFDKAPEDAEVTTENTQAPSEAQEDQTESDGITILSDIKICETCRKFIPFENISKGHTKLCVSCLRHEIESFNEWFKNTYGNSEDTLSEEKECPTLSKFMSVSADDKISIGPEFQAVIPKLQDKTLKKPSTRKPNLIWRPTPASLKDLSQFLDNLNKRALYFTEEQAIEILGENKFNLQKAIRFCNRKNEDFKPYYEKSNTNRRLIKPF